MKCIDLRINSLTRLPVFGGSLSSILIQIEKEGFDKLKIDGITLTESDNIFHTTPIMYYEEINIYRGGRVEADNILQSQVRLDIIARKLEYKNWNDFILKENNHLFPGTIGSFKWTGMLLYM